MDMSKGIRFHAKEELIRVIFMPINSRLKEGLGSSLIEVHENSCLHVSFITGKGNLRVKFSPRRFIIYEWSVEIPDRDVEYVLFRFALFLRRNSIGIISIMQNSKTQPLTEHLRHFHGDILMESFGHCAYLEFKINPFLEKRGSTEEME